MLNVYPWIDYQQLRALPALSTVVLTVNNRLTRSVIQSLAEQYGRTSEIPLVVPWSGWLSHLLAQLSFEDHIPAVSYVLDSFASHTLWSQVIQESESTRPLLDINQAATAAMQADVLMEEWEVNVADSMLTEEFQSFERWRDLYRERLHAMDALDPNQLIERVLLHLVSLQSNPAQAGFVLPAHVVLAGFTEISPRMKRVLNALSSLGIALTVLKPTEINPGHIQRVLAPNSQSEWCAAVSWARQQLTQNPQGRFAIVAVSLDREAPFARRVLDRVLSAGPVPHSFNVAVARPLSEWRVARAMLAWLRTFVLMKEQMSAEPIDLGAALLAGHCAGDEREMGARARVDARWRDRQTTQVSLAGWSRAIEHLTALSPAWQRAWQEWQGYPRKTNAQQWSQKFRSTLALLGFPGEAQQSSVSYQVTEALDALLDRFAALTPVLEQVSASEALSLLNRLARSTPFQPQRDASARLDVLGLLEAEGGRWDGVWMLGLTDDELPAAAKPNPFIPLAALRQAGAPRATPERERDWAQQIYHQLCLTAPEIIVSSSVQEGERGLRPSPLIADVPEMIDGWNAEKVVHQRNVLAELIDDKGPVLLSTQITAGGVNVLETQSCNPLWGFVRYRLGVQGLKPYATLPSKTLRGIYLHAVMQRIWEQLGTQNDLIVMSQRGELPQWVTQLALTVASEKLHDYPEMWQQLESERAVPLLLQWLGLEARRLAFVVTEIEQKRLLEIGSGASRLKLELRLDRLDTLVGDERQIVIDYKSGAKLPDVLKDWRQRRLVSLQLPSYAALMMGDPVASDLQEHGACASDGLAGFILVQLHSSRVAAIGLIDEDIGLPGPVGLVDAKFTDTSWDETMQRLQKGMVALADEFLQGVATNQSYNKNDLKYCDVMPILRVYAEDQDD